MSILRPSKHTNLRYSIVNISASILKILQENEIMKYHDLLDMLKLNIGADVNEVFTLSLTFLYIMNKIEYIKELDTIRLINETL